MGYAVKLQNGVQRYLFVNDINADSIDRCAYTGDYIFNPKYPYRYLIHAGYPNVTNPKSIIDLEVTNAPLIYSEYNSSYGISIWHIDDTITSLSKFKGYASGSYCLGAQIFEFKKPIQQITTLARGATTGNITFPLTKGTFIFAWQISVNGGSSYLPPKYGKLVYPQQYPDENNLQGSAVGVYMQGEAYGFIYKNDTGMIVKNQSNNNVTVVEFTF